MKKNIQIIFLVSFFLISFFSGNIARSQSKSEKVKSALLELFEYCANDDYNKAAQYLVYIGEDTTRRWIDVYSYDNNDDQKEIIGLCHEIKRLVENGGEFEFTQYSQKKESEELWCIWTVEFQKGTKKKAYFACLKVKGNYALGDID